MIILSYQFLEIAIAALSNSKTLTFVIQLWSHKFLYAFLYKLLMVFVNLKIRRKIGKMAHTHALLLNNGSFLETLWGQKFKLNHTIILFRNVCLGMRGSTEILRLCTAKSLKPMKFKFSRWIFCIINRLHYFSFKNHDYEKNKGPSINEHKNDLETMCFKALLIDPSGLQVLAGTLSLNFQAIC